MDVGADQEVGLLGQGQPPVEHQKQCLEEKAARKVSKVMNRNDTMHGRMIRAESWGRKYSLCRRLRCSGSTGLRIVYGPNIAGTVMTCAFPGNVWRFQVQGSDKSNNQTRLS